jgi:ubiquinone/menaquinone biosynthesis C-methylase UbiE
MSDSAGYEDAAERRRIEQGAAFDAIGPWYDQAFPHKEGQVAAGAWVVERLKPGARVLDVGCGSGVPTARQFVDAGFRVTGIDISRGMLASAVENVPEGVFGYRDVLQLEPTAEPYDAVVAFFSLLMLTRADLPEALRRIRAVLVPGGLFALSMVEADMDDVVFNLLGADLRVSGLQRDELRAVVEAAGFTVESEDALTYTPATPEVPPEVQLFLTGRRND